MAETIVSDKKNRSVSKEHERESVQVSAQQKKKIRVRFYTYTINHLFNRSIVLSLFFSYMLFSQSTISIFDCIHFEIDTKSFKHIYFYMYVCVLNISSSLLIIIKFRRGIEGDSDVISTRGTEKREKVASLLKQTMSAHACRP